MVVCGYSMLTLTLKKEKRDCRRARTKMSGAAYFRTLYGPATVLYGGASLGVYLC